MDLYVERQCIEKLRKGKLDSFLLLFDSSFADLYKYVSRRVSDLKEVERIVRLTFLDCLNKYRNTPADFAFVVWLYALAHSRVYTYLNGISSDEDVLCAMSWESLDESSRKLKENAEKMLKKLSLEEREILMLKFFEEVSDSDITQILGLDEVSIGPRIYKVLKRAHFLLFGDSDEMQGVYFGELSGFLLRVRDLEAITVSEALKLRLRADLSAKITSKDMAIDAELVNEEKSNEAEKHNKSYVGNGSDDPAKIFVEAARGLGREEVLEIVERRRKEEKAERFAEGVCDFCARWRVALFILPLLFVLVLFGYLFWLYLDDGKISRGFPSVCENSVVFFGEFSDGDKVHINKYVSDRLCEHFDVLNLVVSDSLEGGIYVEVDIDTGVDFDDLMLEYRFVRFDKGWKIKKYVRHLVGNDEFGQIS